MKQLLKNILLFTLFSITLYIILLVAWGSSGQYYLKNNLRYKRGSHGHLYSRLREADTTHNIDILFLGSSHTYRGYDPRIFNHVNYRTFNLGSSAQAPAQTEVLLKRYLEQFNPKLVIFDVYPELFDSDGIESMLDLISNMQLKNDVIQMALKSNNIKIYNTLLYGYLRDICGVNNKFKEEEIKGPDKYIKGGYVETNKKHGQSPKLPNKRDVIFSEYQLSAFKNILQHFKEKDIPYILVQAPVTKKKYDLISNRDELSHSLSQFGPYLNFNEIVHVPDSLFFDDNHLNQQGVEMYNHLLIEKLKQKDLLPR